MPRYTLRTLLIAVTTIGCCGGLIRSCYIALTHFETAENVEHVTWLPKTASNVSYYRSYLFTAFEFDISEPEFQKWSVWKVHSITTPITLHRYALARRDQPSLGPNPSYDQMLEWQSRREVTITDGLAYEHHQSNGGGIVVAYDKSKGRAYYWPSPR
jgi:hypothetical protein